MQAILFAIIAYFTWGIGIFFEAIVARRLNSHSLMFWGFLLSFLLMSLYIPYDLDNFYKYSFSLLIFNLALGLFALATGTFTYFEALKRENRALVGTIASSFPMVTVLFSLLFLNEMISLSQGIAISIIFAGLFLSIISKEFHVKNFKLDQGIFLSLIAMFAWGIYFALLKIVVLQVGWFWPNYIAISVFPLILLYMKLRSIKLEGFTRNNALTPLIVSTVLVRVAEFSYSAGISQGLVAIVAPIAGANPTLFVIFAFLFFKDPITKQQTFGIITTLTGIILLSFFSV
ncbi:DMT family transporter [Candidatus Daviesbacteria bacterium]|nr:DMT family transporter [Candidatus Daviesbacteria bacterium]